MLIIKENEIKHFKFDVEIKGTKELPSARLVFEGKDSNKMFPVTNSDGLFSHSINYSSIKDLKEGDVYLEVLVGKTYFRPWKDKYTIVEPIIKESVVEQKPTVIKETVAPKPTKTETIPFSKLKKEYKSLLQQKGIVFLEGDNSKNIQIKKRVLTILENKYGKEVRPNLLKLNSIKVDELLIL
jgi:hypothetical protein